MKNEKLTNNVLPLISVIVPVYNAEQYLRNCLESVCGQTYTNLQIICVNDGSDDCSAKILEEYAKRDTRILLLHQQNAGQAAARNLALRHVVGEYIASLDSDDYLEKNAYEKVEACLRKHPGIDMVWFGTEVECLHDDKLRRTQEQYCRVEANGVHPLPIHTLHTLSGAMWNKVVRTELFRRFELNYPEGMVFEDACLFGMVAAVVKRVYFLSDKLYHYVLRQNSTMGMARAKSSRSSDALNILRPMHAFYRRWNLLPTAQPIFESFFVRAWGLYCSIMPVETHRQLAKEVLQLAQELKMPDDSNLMRRLLRMNDNCEYERNRWGVFSVSRQWNGLCVRFLGVKILQEKLMPDSSVTKSLFYARRSRKEYWSFLGIPVYGKIVSDFVVTHCLFGLPVSRTVLISIQK